MSLRAAPTRPPPARLVAGVVCGLLFGLAPARAEPVITEFMASNSTTLFDQDRDFSDWIEVHNPDATAVNLSGWYLTDTASNRTRWQFPAVTLAPGAYLVVFASNKNRRDPAAELHTNFALAAEGEYLALVKPDGVTVTSEYAPTYPAQSSNVSYGLATPLTVSRQTGFFRVPTPGTANGPMETATLGARVQFSRPSGPFSTSFLLELSGATAGQHIRYVSVPAGPGGAAAPDPTSTSPRYSGPIGVSGPVLIRAAVFSDDLQSRGLPATAQYFTLDLSGPAGLAGFATKHPVLVLEPHGLPGLNKEDGARPGWLYAYAARPAGGRPFNAPPDFASSSLLEVRGSSSANFPKKSYNVDFVNDLGENTGLSLLGSPPFDEWALVGPWLYDPALIRNMILYSLSNRIGRWAPRTQPVEVFVNAGGGPLDRSAYVGVYVLTDKIDLHPDRLALDRMSAGATNEPEITGAYVLKIDAPDPSEYGWTTDRGLDLDTLSTVNVASPKADRLSSAQRTYIRGYVQKMEDALHADRASGWRTRTHLDYLDRPSWVDHHILNTFAANPDAFERSAYFHKPRGGKILAGPVWDFDRAMGSYWDERSFRPDLWYGEGAVQPWSFGWWGILATDPDFRQAWIDRWHDLRRDALGDTSLAAVTDQFAVMIGPEAAARDAARWPDNVSLADGTYAGEIAHLRNWLIQRARWIDAQFVPVPSLTATGGSLVLDPPADAQIAYTLDGSDPRAAGGDLAPGALLAPGRVTVPATANLHARSYRASARDAFPGTPWSAAVGGPNSTPLTPASRLANLSSRAAVGTGDDALIAGVVVSDTAAKRYLARAIGPALTQFGASGVVPDPQLTVFSPGAVELYRNVGWPTGPDAARLPQLAQGVGAFALPAGSADSALVVGLAASAYTVQVTTPGGRSGIGLAELYELDGNGRTVNLSTRARVGTDDRVLIGGFVVSGAAHKRMLIRAVGPTLTAFGLAGALADPVLTLYAGTQVMAANDRWSSDPAATAAATA
ncbi:MAG: CotH kinase family protein, partial [Opitutaceae bacterium]|nr:CotH kinase family protein [Opitutaceae bacterium]